MTIPRRRLPLKSLQVVKDIRARETPFLAGWHRRRRAQLVPQLSLIPSRFCGLSPLSCPVNQHEGGACSAVHDRWQDIPIGTIPERTKAWAAAQDLTSYGQAVP